MERISEWSIRYTHFNPSQESLREALCTLGNGYMGTRGAQPEETASKIHYPGTYIAGVYNKLSTNIAGRTVINEDMVNCPNWVFITFKIGNGKWFSPSASKILSFSQELNMKEGILLRKIRFVTPKGEITTVKTCRVVHMKYPHLGAIEYTIIPENYNGLITVRTMLDGAVENTGVERYRQLNSKHLRFHSLGRFDSNGVFLVMRTSQSRIIIAEAERIKVFVDGKQIRPNIKPITWRLLKGQERIGQEFRMFVKKRHHYRVEKIVGIYTSKDFGVKDPILSAVDLAKTNEDFSSLVATHKEMWRNLWDKADMEIKADVFYQAAIRFHIFHLLQTASIHNVNIDAGIPARGLHGESYRGHIFWDEIFTMFFYDLHFPQISKASLMYRYRRLLQAREYARENGYEGAMFPWQSGSSGKEETQLMHLNPLSGKWGPDHSRLQRHVSFAIAYNVWKYFRRTQDLGFLKKFGAELFLSIAQFGASLAKYDRKDGRYHTYGLMGPDEFHEKYPNSRKPGLKDNAYTNVMIVWTLLRGKELIALLDSNTKERIFQKIGLTSRDLKRWDKITNKMALVVNKDGIISQFDGYFSLKEIDWDSYRKEYGDIQRMDRILKAEGKSPDDYQVTKQADVMMIFYLLRDDEVKEIFSRLGYRIGKDILERNYNYYIARTSHGSTLSRVVHCFLAYKLGRFKEAEKLFKQVLDSDIHDIQGGTTSEGIHIGIMGGSIDIVLRGFLRLDVSSDMIILENPHLPSGWKMLRFKFLFHNDWVKMKVSSRKLEVSIEADRKIKKIPLKLNNRLYYISSSEEKAIKI